MTGQLARPPWRFAGRGGQRRRSPAVARRVTVTCHGCGRTETVRASRLQPCDGYCCVWWHGPDTHPAPGLSRDWVVNAARGFDGWRDAALGGG